MGNDHSCDIHDSHPNRHARDACIQERKSASEIRELKKQYQNKYRCEKDHYHTTLESKNSCEESDRRKHELELERVRSARRYTCNAGHSHSSFEEVQSCHEFKLKKTYLNVLKKRCEIGNPGGMADMGFPGKCMALDYKPSVIVEHDSDSDSD